ncbi:MAG: hypothetical protein ACRD8W_15110 [Nitrososphaeraceae archaeon]
MGQHKTLWEEEISEHDLLEEMWKSSNENPQKDRIDNTKKVLDLEVFIGTMQKVNFEWENKENMLIF